eukprot:811680-Prorocentrum_minimum.AAC.1
MHPPPAPPCVLPPTQRPVARHQRWAAGGDERGVRRAGGGLLQRGVYAAPAQSALRQRRLPGAHGRRCAPLL